MASRRRYDCERLQVRLKMGPNMRLTMAVLLAGAFVAANTPLAAQDIPSPYDGAVAEHGQRQMMDRLAKRRLEQAYQRQRGATHRDVSPRAKATCRNKAQAAATLGRNDPKVRQLYALCAQAGY